MKKRFTTRLKELKKLPPYKGKTKEHFRKLIQGVEKSGAFNLHVVSPTEGGSWSYSIGFYDTYGQPEIIVSGFPVALARAVFDEIHSRYKNGEALQNGDAWTGLLSGDYSCAFRTVERKWANRLMLSTVWFYGDLPFPALQCICPDFENKLPWQRGFDKRWRSKQALFYRGAKRTELENDLWDSNERSK